MALLTKLALNTSQNVLLKAAINANPLWAAFPLNSDGDYGLAIELNKVAVPDYIVWRTDVTRAEIYGATSIEATNWSFVTYKAQTLQEQNTWVEMFTEGQANFALLNLRTAVGSIFGVNAAPTLHVLAIAKRPAKYAEKILASGAGTLLAPSTMTLVGNITPAEVQVARMS